MGMGWSISRDQRAFALMYHDVVADGAPHTSGFRGPAADLYKLDLTRFREHLDAITRVAGDAVALASDPRASNMPRPVFLTFDDGGGSAYTVIAAELERRGWRGHFFVSTDYIARPGFLTAGQIRALRARGHVIGSHTCSHPRKISRCTWEDILREWNDSVRILSRLLGAPVTIASVPGGFYSRQVARAAAAAGIRILFTSEPTSRLRHVHGCTVLGRCFVQRDTPAATAAAFAGASLAPRLRQALLWKAKKLAKAAGGEAWFNFRQWALSRSPGSSAALRPEEQTDAQRSRAA